LLAVELLLFEWRPRSFIPVAISATVAGAFRLSLLGTGPIFPVVPHGVLNMETLAFAALLGGACGLLSGGLTALVYGCEDLFERLPCHCMWWPTLGGLVVGVCGWFEPPALGVGYDQIHALISGQLLGHAVLGLLIGKAIAWSVALGSGTSGGVLAPLLMIGGAFGALLAQWMPAGDAGLWALIGMAAVMSSAMRVPLTALIFALELTHDVNALPALLIGCVTAHAVTLFSMRRSILTQKVARRGRHITQEYAVDPLSSIRVSDVMQTDFNRVSGQMTLREYLARTSSSTPRSLPPAGATLLVDENAQLIGILTRSDLLQALLEEQRDQDTISLVEIASQNVITVFPDDLLTAAIQLMLQHHIDALPVVNPAQPSLIAGYLDQDALLAAHRKKLDEETIRESVWGRAPQKNRFLKQSG